MTSIKEQYDLSCDQRNPEKSAHFLRQNGNIILDLYLKNSSALHLVTDEKNFLTLVNDPTFMTKIVKIVVEGKSYFAMPKKVNFDSLYKKIISVEYAEIKANEKIQYLAPIQVINEDQSIGIKKGGRCVKYTYECKLKSLPKDMIDRVIIDLAASEYGQKFFAKDGTNLTKNIEIVDNVMIAKIVGRVTQEVEKTEDAKPAEAAAATKTTTKAPETTSKK